MSEKALIMLNHKRDEMDDLTPRVDKITDVRRERVLNEQSTITFRIARNNPKAKYLFWPETTFELDNRVYCILGDDAITETRNEAHTLDVTLKEIWYKLSKVYLTAYNMDVETSPEVDHIDTHMVMLLGNSPDPLYINGQKVTAPYPVGTAKYLFWCLLYGTGWSLDERYADYWPDDVFDLETDKKSVLENIELLQGLFGGFMLWDSKRKTAALIDENKYRIDNGFQVAYATEKGILVKGITKKMNRDIVTKLYPYGNSFLNIADVNGGKEYLESYSYTEEVLVGHVQHNDIYKQDTLLKWGQRQLEKMSRPQISYEFSLLDMRKQHNAPYVPGPVLAEMCTVIDEGQPSGEVSLRVIGINDDPFNEWDKQVTVGEPTDRWPKVIRDIIQAENTVSNTVSNTNKITGSIIRGETPALTTSNKYWSRVTGGLSTRVGTTESGLATLTVQTGRIEARVSNAEGSISSLTITANQIQGRVSNVEGNVSSLTIRADSIESNVRSLNGRMGTAETRITQTDKNVSVHAYSDGQLKASVVVSSINSGSISINANRIRFDGALIGANDATLLVNTGSANLLTTRNLTVMNNIVYKGYDLYVQGGYVRARQ